MRKEITDLQAALATANAAVDAEVANSALLKSKLDQAIAGQLSDQERAALAAATDGVLAIAQKAADSTAANAPSN